MVPVASRRTIGWGVCFGLLLGAAAAHSAAAPAATPAPAAAAVTPTPAAVAAAAPVRAPAPGATPEPLYRVERAAAGEASAATLELSVGADNQAALTLVRSAPAPANETLRCVLSLFKSADEGSFAARVFLHDRHAPDTPDGFTIPEGSLVLPLTLFAPDLPPVGTWRGTLTLVPPAPAKPAPPIALSLTRSTTRPATLVVEGAPAPVVITLGLFGQTPEGPLVSVTLRDVNGYGPVEGLRATLEDVPQAPDHGFDPGRQLSFWFDGRPVADFLSWPPRAGDERSLAARGQARLGIGLRDLRAGDTTLTLRVRAANSGDDDRQRVTLKLHVRHHLAWAIVVLLGAIGLSFLSTQVVTALRRSAAVERQVRELEGGWLRDEPALPPVIWVRAVLAQARELSGRWPLWTGDAPDKLIEAARAELAVLGHARDVRARFDDAGRMMRYHARRAVREALSRLGGGPVGADALARARTRLDSVASWRTAPAAYWDEIAPSVHSLATQVDPSHVADATARTLIADLLDALRVQLQAAADVKVRQGSREAPLDGVEEAYARLKVAWEHRQRLDDVKRLAACEHEPLEVFFQVADDLAWERLKQPAALAQLRIETPPEGACEAFRPLTYSVVAPGADAELAELLRGYLFRYGVQFRWTFTLRRDGGVRHLTPVSEGPVVVQFAPEAGELDVQVTLVRDGRTAGPPIAGERIRVAPSSAFGWVRNLRAVEMLYLGAATVVALVSGLSASYLKSPSFGSLQDYFTLFLLGIGADQAKNLVQSLSGGAPAGAASAPATAAGAANPPAAPPTQKPQPPQAAPGAAPPAAPPAPTAAPTPPADAGKPGAKTE